MTEVGRWRLLIFLFPSMAGAAIASADRMKFPADPEAYEPSTKATSGSVTGPFAPVANAEQQQGLRDPGRPMVTSPMIEAPNASGAYAPSIPLIAPGVEEVPKPLTPDVNRGASPSKLPAEDSPPSKRIVKRQSHALTPAPPKSVVAVGIIGGILLISFLIKRLAGSERWREKSIPREPVLVPGVCGASITDIVGSPEYLRFFGLDATAREEDVLRAYRERSWSVHPDHGGDPAAFKEMQRRFEQSLAFVRRRRRSVSLP